MRGRVAKALRRTRLTSERPGDRDIVMRMAAREQALRMNQPKPLQQRTRKARGTPGLQGYSDAQVASFAQRSPIVASPLRALCKKALSFGVEPGIYLRHATDKLLKGVRHAGQQPKWMLDRMAISD